MEEGYVVIDQIPTRVITIGGWIDQPIKKRHLIIVIPGNPGLIGYYEDFVKSLYDELPDEYVIWGISHASHDIPKNTVLPTVKGNQLSSENSTTSASGTPAIVPVNVRTSMSLLNPQALERSLFLARDQLKMVDELNAKDIRLHSDRLVLYFGTNDRWCPLEYCHNLLRQVPKARAIICPHEFEHAFVLQSSQQMATIVSEWIKEFS